MKKTREEGWGSKVVECLAADLADAFPGVSGFSKRNLELMRQFAERYPDGIYETAVSQIPWGHNIALMQRLKQYKDRLWYAQQTIDLFRYSGFVDLRDYFGQFSIQIAGVISTSVYCPRYLNRKLAQKNLQIDRT